MKVLKTMLIQGIVGVIFAAALLCDFSLALVRERRQNSCLDEQKLEEIVAGDTALESNLRKFDQQCCQNLSICTFSQTLSGVGGSEADISELLDIFFCKVHTTTCSGDEECSVINDAFASSEYVGMKCHPKADSVEEAVNSILYILLGCTGGPVLITIVAIVLCCYCKRKRRKARKAVERAAELENSRALSDNSNQTGNTKGRGKTKQKDESTNKPQEFRVYVNNELAETVDVKERRRKKTNVVEVRVETTNRQAASLTPKNQTKAKNKKEKSKAKSKDNVFEAETLPIAETKAGKKEEKPAKADIKDKSKPTGDKANATYQNTPQRKETINKYQGLEPRDEMKRSINTYLDLTGDRPSATKEADYENDFHRYEYPTDAEITELQSDTTPRPVTGYITMIQGNNTKPQGPLFPESYDDEKDTPDGREVKPSGDIPYDNVAEDEYVYMETSDDIEGNSDKVDYDSTHEEFSYLVPLPIPQSAPATPSPSAPPLPPR